jgi:putative MATE family efflux protein
MADHTERLGNEMISSLIIKLSFPCVAAHLIHAVYNITDRIFIGYGVGPLGLSGVSLVFPVILIQISLCVLIEVGATALISISLGERDKKKANLVLGNACTLLLVISITCPLLASFIVDTILNILSTSETAYPYAKDYLTVMLWGMPITTAGYVLASFIRAEGNPIITLYILLFGSTANIILDAILIFQMNMGVKGAAYATVFSQAATAVSAFCYFKTSQSTLKLELKNLILKQKIVKRTLALGTAPSITEGLMALYGIIMNYYLMLYGGNEAVAAQGIILTIHMVIFMFIFGACDGAQPILGYNHGALYFDRVKETLMATIKLVLVFSTLLFLIIQMFPVIIVKAFTNNKSLIDITSKALRLVSLSIPIAGISVVGSFYFQATGRAFIATALGIIREVVFFIPVIVIMAVFFRLKGVWLSIPIADTFASLLTAVLIIIEIKKLNIGLEKKQIENS